MKKAKPNGETKSRAQHDRAPLLNIRIPRKLHRDLKAAAKADNRTMADWLRMNLPTLIERRAIESTARENRQLVIQGNQFYEITPDPMDPIRLNPPILSDVKGAKP